MVPPRSHAGLTLAEVVIAIVIVGVLGYLILPAVIGAFGHGSGFNYSLSNQRQLHLATQQMALDGETTGNSQLGWPGDTGGTFSNWTAQLITNGYLSTNDFCKLMSGPGIIVPQGKIPGMNETSVRVYTVRSNSPTNAVFLTSANFTNTPSGGDKLKRSTPPYGNKGFVVFRKGGDGAILLPNQVGNTNHIGGFAPLCK